MEASSPVADVRTFHYRDGLYFTRRADGAVCIHREDAIIAVVDPHSWSSVVASMSAGGEDARTYEQARDFHGFDHTKVQR